MNCCITRIYHPFGSGLSGTIPNVPHQNQIVLTFPFDNPSIILVIRTPEFGNTFKEQKNRIYRETRGGSIKVFRDSIWPKSKKIEYNFIVLRQSDIDTLYDLIDQSLGLYIGLTDFENRQWKVIILNPTTAVSEKYMQCGFSIKLEMQGDLAPITITEESITSTLSVSHSVVSSL